MSDTEPEPNPKSEFEPEPSPISESEPGSEPSPMSESEPELQLKKWETTMPVFQHQIIQYLVKLLSSTLAS